MSSTVRSPHEPSREGLRAKTSEPGNPPHDREQNPAEGEGPAAPGYGAAPPSERALPSEWTIPAEAASAPELAEEPDHASEAPGGGYAADTPRSEPPLVDPFPRPRAHPTALAPSNRLAVFVSLIAMSTAVVAIAVLGWGAHRWQELAQRDAAAEGDDEGTTRRTRMGSKKASSDDEPDPPVDAPARTGTHDEGGITVVDLGIDAPSLDEALKEQRATAEGAGQTMLLMLTGRRCEPCQGVDASLSDPRMQEALAGVRLVRVDLEVFGEELSLLNLPTDLYPSFFLLRSDLTPVDAIHGGEWDADIPANIAPVLGPFLRGDYHTRRYPEWAPTTTGIEL